MGLGPSRDSEIRAITVHERRPSVTLNIHSTELPEFDIVPKNQIESSESVVKPKEVIYSPGVHAIQAASTTRCQASTRDLEWQL